MKIKKILSLFLSLQVATSTALAAETLKFRQGCSADQDIQIVAVGDILLHAPLQYQATKNKLRFKSLWSSLIPLISSADLAYANLEGAVASQIIEGGQEKSEPVGFVFDREVYTSYPRFNYHDYLVADIKESGFDVVSTANNHTLDREAIGADKTIQVLRAAGLLYTGTKTSKLENTERWHTVTQTKGRNIAWLACTYGTNGRRDKFNQVLKCFENRELILSLIKELSRDPKVDAVIVTPHWGDEYSLTENSKQKKLAREILEAGAVAVIGTHPHVVQPWEKYTTTSGREGFIAYSTGNFVAGQKPIERRTSMMVSLSLTARAGEKLEIRGVEFVPLLIKHGKIEAIDVRELYIENPEKLPPEAVAIWSKNYAMENIMKTSREESLKSMCDLNLR